MISSCPSEVGTVEDEPEATGDSVPVMMLDNEEELESDPDIAPRMLVYESYRQSKINVQTGLLKGCRVDAVSAGNFGYCRRVTDCALLQRNTLHALDDVFMTIKIYFMPLSRVHT